MKLTKGETYDVRSLALTGWAEGVAACHWAE